jgi:transposase
MVAVQAARITELRAQVATLAAANATLAAANATLAQVNTALEERVAELERRFGQNSFNSSRPPSQDGLRKPARPERHGQSGRRPGKQPGAPGGHLARVDDPSQVVVHTPEHCARCGAGLANAVAGVQARQVFDLPRLAFGSSSIGVSGAAAHAAR